MSPWPSKTKWLKSLSEKKRRAEIDRMTLDWQKSLRFSFVTRLRDDEEPRHALIVEFEDEADRVRKTLKETFGYAGEFDERSEYCQIESWPR